MNSHSFLFDIVDDINVVPEAAENWRKETEVSADAVMQELEIKERSTVLTKETLNQFTEKPNALRIPEIEYVEKPNVLRVPEIEYSTGKIKMYMYVKQRYFKTILKCIV